MTDQAPSVKELVATIPAAAAGVAQDQVVGEAPFAGAVTEVRLIPEAGVTGHASNFRTFRLVNKGQSGAGSTVVAAHATDATPTKDLAAFDEKSLVLSIVAGATTVAEGDVLAVDETVAASGVAHSGYKVVVKIARS